MPVCGVGIAFQNELCYNTQPCEYNYWVEQFAKSILDKEPNAVEKYVGFLKSGGSDYPIEILKKAGVDMTTSKPLEATIDRFNELLDMLEKEI